VNLRRALAPVVLVALATLAACGGGDSPSTASDDQTTAAPTEDVSSSVAPAGDSDVAACDLLTTAEVAAAVGSPVKTGTPSSGPAITGGTFTSCLWQSDDPDHPADTATLTVYTNTAAADSAREADSQDLEGIGDKAYSASVSSVWAYVGERSFFAQWYEFGTMDEEGLEQSKALAIAAADKL
jgi:hypothetical protein